jgi:hypothetical protein
MNFTYDGHRAAERAGQWQYATIARHHPARWQARSTNDGYYIQFVSLEKASPRYQGAAPQNQIVRLRAESLSELRLNITSLYPEAVFSTTNPNDLKVQHAEESRQKKVQQDAIAEEKRFNGMVLSEYKKLYDEATPEQQQIFIGCSFQDLAKEGAGWAAWCKAHPNFSSYPNGTWENHKRILKYCEDHGTFPPTWRDLAAAISALLKQNALFLQASYKRSETWVMKNVQPYSGIGDEPPAVDEATIREAFRRLTAEYGAPVKVSVERLAAVGYTTNAEAVFNALQSRYAPQPDVKNKTAADMKEDLAKMRVDARGGTPLPRSETRKGW